MGVSQTSVDKPEPAVDLNWTFRHAYLTLLNGVSDSSASSFLSRFVELNKKHLLAKNLPFQNKTSKTASDDFQIGPRIVKNKLTCKQQKDVSEISTTLRLDVHEVARIVQITAERIPDESEIDSADKSLFQSRESHDDVTLFYSNVIKESRAVLKTLLYLIKNEHSLSPDLQDICYEIKQNGYDLLQAYIESLVEWNKTPIEISQKSLQMELELLVMDMLNLILYLIFKTGVGFTKGTAMKWFRLMKDSNFCGLSRLCEDDSNDRVATFESLCTILSLVMLDLDFNFGALTDEDSFTNDPEIMYAINDCLLTSHANSIVLYAWSIILHRKHLVISNNPSHPISVQLIQKFGGLENLQKIYLTCAKKAEELDVCASMIRCHAILSYDSLYDAILAAFVVAFVPYIQLNDNITLAIRKIMTNAPDRIVERFFLNPATEDLMAIARAKLPLSIKSFIRLVGINSNLAYEELANLKSYMEVFKEEDFYYKYLIDDENPQLIKLTQDIDVLPPYETPGELSLLLKEGTKAQLFPGANKDDLVVAFLYDYNGWTLLGRILKNLSKKLDSNPEKVDLACEIFQLMTKISQELEKDKFDEVIKAMSMFADDCDVIEVIFRILEQALQLRNVHLLQSGFDLLSSLSLCGYSFRIWSYLYKSQLLGLKANAGLASTILGTVEMVKWRYGFTLSLLKLTNSILDDCLVVSDDVNWKLKSEVLDRLVAYCIHVYENFLHWMFTDDVQRLQIGTYAQLVFVKIIVSLYGVDNGTDPKAKVTRVFAQSCERITRMFLVPDIQVSRTSKPILETFSSLSDAVTDIDTSGLFGLWQQRFIDGMFEFATTLISIRSACQGTLASAFEMDLYSIIPRLVDLYAGTMNLRASVLNLLSSLVSTSWEKEPPSLLTHLGQEHTQLLLKCLAVDMANEFETHGMKIALFRFFSSVMEGDQEGLSIVFITGRNIKDCILDEKKSLSKEDKLRKSQLSLLKILKALISKISVYPSNVSLKLVESLALAFNSWTTAKEDNDDEKFVMSIISELSSFPKPLSTDDGEAWNEYFYQVNIKAKMAEIVSLYLFVSKNNANKTKIYQLLNSQDFIAQLKDKFELEDGSLSPIEHELKEFTIDGMSFKLSQFERTPFFVKEAYGHDSSHSLELMDKLFEKSAKWEVVRNQVIASSLSFQLVSARVTAAKSFGALVTCFCKNNGVEIDPQYISLATTLLKINDQEGIISPNFAIIYQERIDLAFFVCLTFSKRKENKFDDKIVFPLISSACQLLVSNDIDLLGGLLSFENQNYRPLLRTLLIALGMIKKDTMLFMEYGATFVDIFSAIIANSVKTIFKSIQNEVMASRKTDYGSSLLVCKQADDLSLIISLLHTLVNKRLPRDLEVSIAKLVIDSGLFRSTANFFSCSHLIKVNQEAVFSEISLKIINELVQLKPVAEKLLANGLFMVLVDSQISVQIQRGDVSPVVPATARLHQIWVDGLLSTILTLITTFGEKLSSEIYLFVKSFSKQFQSTLSGWLDSTTPISLPIVHETSQIIFLAKALNLLDIYENVASNSDSVKLIPGLDSKEERLNLVNGLNYLISHPKFLSSRIVASNLEEQKLLDSDEKYKLVDRVLDEIKQLKDMLLE
ncbi:hypothetical protein KL912_001449 [Ogataea haglerorum]|nr:hypothetical protein KL923_002112 [Ogataea haglerorum]KAG7749448.1 hypothetical protein KL912_001449 [Ogataea haglerorum]